VRIQVGAPIRIAAGKAPGYGKGYTFRGTGLTIEPMKVGSAYAFALDRRIN